LRLVKLGSDQANSLNLFMKPGDAVVKNNFVSKMLLFTGQIGTARE